MEAKRNNQDLSVMTDRNYKMYCCYDVLFLYDCIFACWNKSGLSSKDLMFVAGFITM